MLSKIKDRMLHHKQYTDRHGYGYTVFFYVSNISHTNNTDSTIVLAPDPGRIYSPGWLKVFAFNKLLTNEQYKVYDFFFYIDMDVLIYNMAMPVTDILLRTNHSIYLSLSNPEDSPTGDTVLTPSHAVIMRNSQPSRDFTRMWLQSHNECPSINMEQGALYATTAKWFDLSRASAEGFACSCRTRAHQFGLCYHHYMNRNHKDSSLSFTNEDVYIVKYYSRTHVPPRDGFTAFPEAIDMGCSCPLTLHSSAHYKNFSEIPVQPNYDNCSHIRVAASC